MFLCIIFFHGMAGAGNSKGLFLERVYARVNCMLTAAATGAGTAAGTAAANVARLEPEKRVGHMHQSTQSTLIFSVSHTHTQTHTPQASRAGAQRFFDRSNSKGYRRAMMNLSSSLSPSHSLNLISHTRTLPHAKSPLSPMLLSLPLSLSLTFFILHNCL